MTTTESIDFSCTYKPSAIYYKDADSLEYVRKDVPCVYRRIDDFLTLVVTLRDREPIGFKLKGFGNFYIRNIKNKADDKQDFLDLVAVLEQAVCDIGDQIFLEEKRIAYRRALDIARSDKVEVRDFPRQASA